MTRARSLLAVDRAGAVAFVAGQSADLLTWAAFRPVELNPLVVALGLPAVAWKLGLMAGVVLVAWTIGQPWGRRVFVAGLVIGIVGAVSNVPLSS
ncbi:MAG: hypothetical protein L0227_10995 [Chloroflexi bacterium]|nr:hypothetical protein [Chloroflexota bacterium]